MRVAGVVYEWKEGSIAEEFRAFIESGDLRLESGAGKLLQRATRVAKGRSDPRPDLYGPVKDLDKQLYCYPADGLIMLYAMEGPEQGKKKRAVILLRVSREQSALPSVADVEIAETRLRSI